MTGGNVKNYFLLIYIKKKSLKNLIKNKYPPPPHTHTQTHTQQHIVLILIHICITTFICLILELSYRVIHCLLMEVERQNDVAPLLQPALKYAAFLVHQWF